MEIELIKKRFDILSPSLNEKTLRLFVATEALALGRGGISQVSKATGISRPTITNGCKELLNSDKTRAPDVSSPRIRKPGGGRKRTADNDATLRSDLERLIEPDTAGDPESPLRWTCKSVRNLAVELEKMGPYCKSSNGG
jgi:hypothetical protein